MIYAHIIAFITGFILDMILGDPYLLPHPVRFMGLVINGLEKSLNRGRYLIFKGMVLVLFCTAFSAGITLSLLFLAYKTHILFGIFIESIMTYQILALKCMRLESMKVYKCLINQDLTGARGAVSMIVGRDTADLDEAGVIRAAVETVAENTSDGVIAPMIYTAVGGPLLGFIYKTVNTLDSMVGYQNEKYLYFGRAAAKTDDVLNFLPSRISAVLMILSACICGRDYSGKSAWKIFWRDRYKHSSPNSAQTESVMAGALSVRLAGDASYFGKLIKKEYIGDDVKNIEAEDIVRAGRLMYMTALLCMLLCIIGMLYSSAFYMRDIIIMLVCVIIMTGAGYARWRYIQK